MTNEISETQATGPITLSDVRLAIGGTDPKSTNSGALRKLIGRGSLATIQKHLDLIRIESAPLVVPAPGATPPAPVEMAAVWAAAYAAAQVFTLGRLEKVTSEREKLQSVCNQQSLDLAAALSDADAMDTKTAAKVAADELAVDELSRVSSTNKIALDSTKAALESLRLSSEAALERLKSSSDAALTIAQKDAQISIQAQQSTIDRLTDQIGELKSLLHKQSNKLS